ncbi:MAG: hypothetical protein LAT62_09235 [Natronospirillum sp.]|uniref:Dyp-type peroxidase n=1 Tax=Natronospirillum sp. TaxID=2812955 RepID=UPI0025DCBBBF|nr:hypothetical protein [Natronospirillum sp.]MCH8552107.1 hypothetical protein [Natronospirillum sp.]
MTRIDLNDVQGNLVKPYGRYGYPVARYLFLQIKQADQARRWLESIIPLVTTGAPWPDRQAQADHPPLPDWTLNLAFTAAGLQAIGVPEKSLNEFPDEFRLGMRARCDILGDDGPSAPEHWDPVWHQGDVHLWLSINARNEILLEQGYADMVARLGAYSPGLVLLCGHRDDHGDESPFQSAGALRENGRVVPKEHFGFVDGISDPYFEGCGQPANHVIGEGKPTRGEPGDASGWEPLATGEFVLGYRDEADEYPLAVLPGTLTRNGTFMVYRKLHQNVASWRRYLDEAGQQFPGGPRKMAAKMAGRWDNGAPLTEFPTEVEADAFMAELEKVREARRNPDNSHAEKLRLEDEYARLRQRMKAFNYAADIPGGRCPVGAHIRRANPRGALEFGQDGAFNSPAALTDRRRLLRRGLPYGSSPPDTTDDGDHGIILMVLGASIKRQFEFVQQEWMNYGNDFRLGNERDPLVGNQPTGREDPAGQPGGHFKVPGGDTTEGREPPHFCAGIPRFVETRGGDYFFVPSLSALHMLAAGIIDPT